EDIESAMQRASKQETRGYTYSYDMLGEAAMTAADAARYASAYGDAIAAVASACRSARIAANPGISVKLSALHPRYEVAKAGRVMDELVPVLGALAARAAAAGMGLNIDAEEADRLGLSLNVIEKVLSDPKLDGWDGFGVAVQGYGRRASDVIDGLHELATRLDRRLMVRLVKGAYWDGEIKRAQVDGLDDFPVFTRKAASDVSFIANARKLLGMADRLYPQFATHNAHSICAVLEMAQGLDPDCFEFQRLHGMGEAVHEIVHREFGHRCRIYAPVGAHRDLLAYLVRRLLENGANSSFVNRIADPSVPVAEVTACPFETLRTTPGPGEPAIRKGTEIFSPGRRNSSGFDLSDPGDLERIKSGRARPERWRIGPILASPARGGGDRIVRNPTTGAPIGEVVWASREDVGTALDSARVWPAPVGERARTLRLAADLFEQHFGEAFSLLATEAGKTVPDAVGELREAVDFLRYYSGEAERLGGEARGLFTCISPWNFPLAIFTGQIAAALAAGNAVLAKPAEATPAIAAWAVRLMHRAGVPRTALQLVPGEGSTVGAMLVSDPSIRGVAFTGSTDTARRIQEAMAANLTPGTPLIAETGGLNAMVVDSTALPEQAIRDIVASAFQSAGQRCSALRCLYVQEEIEPSLREMIVGAMNELELGDPWDLVTDVGPVIGESAKSEIESWVARAESEGRLIHRLRSPQAGSFVPPALLRVNGIEDLEREVFGPVLHLARFRASELERVIASINASGYGLTFGLHSRIDRRVRDVSERIRVGNIYVNRNQIGAVVGSQPFGGEGLSGTGPKAGGPGYLMRFLQDRPPGCAGEAGDELSLPEVERLAEAALEASPASGADAVDLPGPTGELNRLTFAPRLPILCLGPGPDCANEQARAVAGLGGIAAPLPGRIHPDILTCIGRIGGAIWWGDAIRGRAYATALSGREGPIVALITGQPDSGHVLHERHVCIDTTAAGGNAGLLAGRDGPEADAGPVSATAGGTRG
ncbi:MAG: bifunctional proline dehydrogenase/L-glutamate gamma-semialdehyde dehydrogenase PutA, partial [Gammaproteobacteria bacterium]|nr:bifunctional proline dehydrogenase/L-glutamate gamma-semialdehyde dehydrogenase PutA [Gammaproteobacteria bacterium]